MPHEITAFPLPGLEIETGTLIIDACSKLGITSAKHPYGNYLVAYGDAQSLFGIGVNQYALSCYGYDGPLKEVEYGLDPGLIKENKINFKQCLAVLEQQFGIADQKMGDDFITMTQRDGNVLAYARWTSEFFAVYFAIYSGIREIGRLKPYVGQFSFSWTDIVTAAAENIQKQNNYIESLDLEHMDITQARLFKVSNLGGFSGNDTDQVRVARRALNAPLVFETPHRIQALLKDTGSAIVFIPIAAGTLVANAHDSAVLLKGSKSGVWCENALPAKGGGGMRLSVNGVTLQTTHSSKQIHSLLNWLSTEMEIEVSITEYYDC